MSLTIKAFLQKDGKWDAEIRRFQVPADVSSSHDYLSKKLCDIFPALRQGNFSLFWKDPDGDHVAFSTDEEQMEALGFVNDGIFKIYIILKDGGASSSTDNETLHPGIVCDGCEGPVCGPRYKCVVCPDYDLCKTCEGQGKHTQHDMMKITTPGSFPGFPNFGEGFPQMFQGFQCGPPPHGPFGAGPHGPGPQGFVPPPHFRRWMQKFMKRWHTRNGQGCGEAGKDEKKAEEKMDEGADAQASGDDFLRQVGESVATMLDPLGIDVDVHIETPADKEQAEAEAEGEDNANEKKGRRGGCGRRGRGAGRWGHHGGRFPPPPPHGCPPWKMWGWMGGCPMDGGFEAEMGCGQGPAGKCGKKGEKKKADAKQPQTATAPEPQATTSKEPEAPKEAPKETEKRPESPVRMESEPSGQKDNTWTLLNVADETNTSGSQAPPPSAPVEQPPQPQPPQGQPQPQPPQGQPQPPQGQPLYPPADPKIAESLQQMTAMGFSNEGGWLTNLLESKNGDIIQVLDVLRPVQQPRSSEDGTHA